jgi:hypothetical protein
MAQGLAGFGVGERSRAALATTMTSRAFWQAVDRLQVPDAAALELIGYPGKIGPSGKRPRFRLTTHQTRLAGYLSEIEAALENAGLTPTWFLRGNEPHRSPVARRSSYWLGVMAKAHSTVVFTGWKCPPRPVHAMLVVK